MNFTFFIGFWIVLGIATLLLAVYRQIFSAHNETDVVHLGPGEEKQISRQLLLARRIGSIDRFGKGMTVITILIGLGLATSYLYQAWDSPNPGPNNFYRNNSLVK